jgi:hypothetical protein
MPDFEPEPEQIAEFARWLGSDQIKQELAQLMPKLGGPPAARENRIADVASVLLIVAAVRSELKKISINDEPEMALDDRQDYWLIP